MISLLIAYLAGMVMEVSSEPVMMTIFMIGFTSLFVIAGIGVAILVMYASSILVIDDIKPFASIKKSIKLAYRHIGMTFRLAVLISLLSLFAYSIVFFGNVFFEGYQSVQILFNIIGAILSSFLMIFITSIIMNIYIQLSKQEIEKM